MATTVLCSPISERQVYGVKEFSVATIASNGAAGGAAGALKVSMHSSLFGACGGKQLSKPQQLYMTFRTTLSPKHKKKTFWIKYQYTYGA